MWTWLTIIGLSMTPNLVLGPSVAVGVGIKAHYNPVLLCAVITVAGYVEGMLLAWLAYGSTKIGFIHRWCEKMRKPKVVAFAEKWGPWGGLTLGAAMLGQEPILVALRWLGVDMKKIWLPLLVSNALFAVIYYYVVKAGLDQVDNL